MKQSQNLYEYTLQILKIQFLSGAYMPGQIFPSQRNFVCNIMWESRPSERY